MNEEEYGDNYKEHLLEQYKLYVQLTDNTTVQRGNTNKFYITVLSGLLAIVSLFIKNNFPNTMILIISLLGGLLCYTWYVHIKSYKQLNTGRFKVIHEVEKQLPYCCFYEEWNHLKRGNGENYTRLTQIEQKVPIYLGFPYLIIALYYLFEVFSIW
ncbi:hypothetical protein GCM10008986_09820 [Salinibacillus aidingensis]|uniref:Small integral membrane protein n=1 Tax=Salinibacillus aidingensis TaxID=237684 RepID=A0ABP3KSZ9_9BACI